MTTLSPIFTILYDNFYVIVVTFNYERDGLKDWYVEIGWSIIGEQVYSLDWSAS